MAKKVRLTRPELKRHREALMRFERYLPMLKLKQQQLQLTIREVELNRRQAERDVRAAQDKFESYEHVLVDLAGLNVRQMAKPERIETSSTNIAGVSVPVFERVSFCAVTYSLFATPVWVDAALADLRDLNGHLARVKVLREQHDLLNRELTKIIQRVNLFEKVKIPEAQEAIRVIRIHLGDEMTAGVARAKIAKKKITAEEATIYQAEGINAEPSETAPPREADE